MTIATLFATAFVVGLSGAMMPGPLLSATIASSARRGWKAGPLIVLGHAVLELILIIALIAGLSAFLTRAEVTTVIASVGGAFLIYLGYSMSRDAQAGRVQLTTADTPAKSYNDLHPVLIGLLLSISNPFWSVWWATVGLGYLVLAVPLGFTGVGSFYTGHILSDLLWYTLISISVAGGQKFLKQSVYNAIIFMCGLFLIGMGGYFLYTAFFY